MDKVSIIIPVYNAGSYLDRSLKSVCGQSFSNLEILLIDDGSCDGSGGRCDEWALRDSRIRVWHQKNGGVSAARNQGLALATGTYVMFVDADDWIAEDMVRTLYDLITEYQADVSTCDYREVCEESPMQDINQGMEAAKAERAEAPQIRAAAEKVEAGLQLLLPWAVYCKLYRRELLGTLRFQNYKIAEDLLFNTELICDTDFSRAVSTNRKLYYYRIHENSAVREGYQKKYLEGVQAEAWCYDRLTALSPKFGDINIVGCSISMMFERMAQLSFRERRAVIGDFRWCKKTAKEYRHALLDTTNRHRKISGALKVYVPDLYLWTLILRKRR